MIPTTKVFASYLCVARDWKQQQDVALDYGIAATCSKLPIRGVLTPIAQTHATTVAAPGITIPAGPANNPPRLNPEKFSRLGFAMFSKRTIRLNV